MKKRDIYAVILAGGSGTRFWPQSRRLLPKQFLPIVGPKTLFEMTCQRILKKVYPENIFILTNKDHKKITQSQIKAFGIPFANVLCEPVGKNTAPAIAWAAGWLHKKNPRSVMMVLPSDHYIRYTNNYLKVLQQALELAQLEHLVTLGVVPTRPDTGYGYLKVATIKPSKKQVLHVEKFTEKPGLSMAKRFLKSKKYLWNSGMFFWKTATVLEEYKQKLPSIYKALSAGIRQRDITRKWKGLPAISVDYGILEKSQNVVAVPAQSIGWSDLGSWESLYDQLVKDNSGNVLQGDVLALNTNNSLIWAQQRQVSVIDVDHLVVIETQDAVLVCPKESSQKVRMIIDQLKKKKKNRLI